jgi:histone deacetylase 1/2
LDKNRSKLDVKAEECRFLGYDDTRKSYLLWNICRREVIHSRDIVVDETSFQSVHGEFQSASFPTNPIPSFLPTPDLQSRWRSLIPEPPPIYTLAKGKRPHQPKPVPKGKRTKTAPRLSGGECITPYDQDFSGGNDAQVTNLGTKLARTYIAGNTIPTIKSELPDAAVVNDVIEMTTLDPKTVRQAMISPQAQEWKMAMQEEFNALRKKKVFDVVTKPYDRNIVGCRWILKTKRDKHGEITKYRARLVAQGFSQVEGEDFDDTFAPVVKFCTTRILLSLAAQNNLQVYHWDVETAYLNADLQDEIYMKIPEGCEIAPSNDRSELQYALRLRRCLYGLKQSGREWYLEISSSLQSFGFEKPSESDPCLFVHRQRDHRIDMVMCLYVDDLLIATKDEHLKLELLTFLNRKYSIKDMGVLTWYLGMEIARDTEGTYTVTQTRYLQELQSRFRMSDARIRRIPMYVNAGRDDESSDTPVTNEPYRQLIGSLMYAMVATRPDIAFAIGYLSRYVSQPTERVWLLAKDVLRYLKGTMKVGLRFRHSKTPLKFTAYVDADWARDQRSGRSVTGLLVFLGGNLVSWASRQQKCVATSSTEAEYIALSEVTKEILWISRIGHYLDLPSEQILVYEDNQGAMKIAKSTCTHKKSKHVNIRYHFVREHVAEGKIILTWIPTKNMLADLLTKPVAEAEFSRKREIILNQHDSQAEIAHLCIGLKQKRKSRTIHDEPHEHL